MLCLSQLAYKENWPIEGTLIRSSESEIDPFNIFLQKNNFIKIGVRGEGKKQRKNI